MLSSDHLAALVERPEVQRRILGEYRGSYSLGLTLDPADRTRIAIRVRLEHGDPSRIPTHVMLEGERVPVIVSTGFRAPERLPAPVAW